MAQRGRKSAASLAVMTATVPLHSLNDPEAAIWRAITEAMPRDWFQREHHEMLVAYCRSVAMADFVSAEINRYQPKFLRVDGGVERLAKLTKIRDQEVRTAMSLATRLRLTNQSRYDARTAARRRDDPPAGTRRPWDGIELPWEFESNR